MNTNGLIRSVTETRRTGDASDRIAPQRKPSSAKILVRASKRVPREMVSQYLFKSRNNLPALKAALAGYEYEFARIYGHQMKGSGGAYGIKQLTEIGALIERAATDQNIDELGNQVAALEEYLGRVEVAFDESPASGKP
jgi:HPt (histidine-containing phosphotransfer) domain-containing protein